MSTDYRAIYDERAADYDDLIAAEDAADAVGDHLRSLLDASKIEISRALDVGAGTGRLARILRGLRGDLELTCTDLAAAMLGELVRRWPGTTPPDTIVADYRALPLPDTHFDLVTAGWALGHLTGFHPETWQAEAARALAEIERVARPGATLVLFETLGTGYTSPTPPRRELGELYAFFEARGFVRTTLRTDYRFATHEEARRLTGFFFGEKVWPVLQDTTDGTTLIEWTGAWHKTRAA